MGLESALVDRARTIRDEPAADRRVGGSTVMATVQSAWFAALLQLPSGNLARDSSAGRRREITAPTLMFDVVDEDNRPVVVTVRDRIEVESERFGPSMWELTGDPQPLASLSETIGYQASMKKIADHGFEPLRTP